MKKYTVIAIAIGATLCAGCSGTGGKNTASAPRATAAAIANPTDFPLGADAKILDAKPFNQKIASGEGPGGTVLSQGAGTYHGHSVIAQSTAPLADVKAWLTKLEAAPPAGYVYVTAAQHPDAVAVFGLGRKPLVDWNYGVEIVRLTMAAYLSAERRASVGRRSHW